MHACPGLRPRWDLGARPSAALRCCFLEFRRTVCSSYPPRSVAERPAAGHRGEQTPGLHRLRPASQGHPARHRVEAEHRGRADLESHRDRRRLHESPEGERESDRRRAVLPSRQHLPTRVSLFRRPVAAKILRAAVAGPGVSASARKDG